LSFGGTVTNAAINRVVNSIQAQTLRDYAKTHKLDFIQQRRLSNVLNYMQQEAERAGRWLDAYARVFDVPADTIADKLDSWDIGPSEFYLNLVLQGGSPRERIAETMDEGFQRFLSDFSIPQIPAGIQPSEFEEAMIQIKEQGRTFAEAQEEERNALIERLSELGIDVFRLQTNLERAREQGRRIRSSLHSLESTNQQLREALEQAKKVPRPQFKLGQRVVYAPLNAEAEVTDLDIQNGQWVYVVNVGGTEYVARAGELRPSTAPPPPPKEVVVVQPKQLTPEEVRAAFGGLAPIISARVPAGAKFPGLPIPPGCAPESFTDIKDLTEEQATDLFKPFYDAADAISAVPEGIYFVCLQTKVFFKRTFVSTSGRLPQQRLVSIPLPQIVRELRGYLPKARPQEYGPGFEASPLAQFAQIPNGIKVIVTDLGRTGIIESSFKRGARFVYTIRLDTGEVVYRFSESVKRVFGTPGGVQP